MTTPPNSRSAAPQPTPGDKREATQRDTPALVSARTGPDVRQLVEHLTQMQRRVVQDALSEARASYWRRRAAAFRAALPRQDEWHGREGLASVRMRRDRLQAIIAACESAAEVALLQDAEDPSGAVR